MKLFGSLRCDGEPDLFIGLRGGARPKMFEKHCTRASLHSDTVEDLIRISVEGSNDKSNHFYCHITTAHVPLWVTFLRVCSRQCRNNLHIDSTYLQTYTEDNVQNTHTYTQYTQCTIKTYLQLSIHILHSMYTLYIVYTYTHNNMRKKDATDYT